MNLSSCHSNRNLEDAIVLGKISFDILSTSLERKSNSEQFCAVYTEGRERNLTSYEDFASLKSFKLYSQHNYPIFLFVNKNVKEILTPEIIKDYRINIIPIEPLNSLEEYTNFCTQKLYFMLPDWAEQILTLQPDATLIKNGWESYITVGNYDFLGSHWMHTAAIDGKIDDEYYTINQSFTRLCNGAFSFRKASKMREVSKMFGNLTLRERGRNDNRPPMEDLFYSLGFGYNILKRPTLEESCKFCKDPISYEQYLNKVSFGFHYPVLYNKYCCLEH